MPPCKHIDANVGEIMSRRSKMKRGDWNAMFQIWNERFSGGSWHLELSGVSDSPREAF